jgi:hypothetical protein
MKKVILFLAAIFVVCACGNKNEKEFISSNTSSVRETTLTDSLSEKINSNSDTAEKARQQYTATYLDDRQPLKFGSGYKRKELLYAYFEIGNKAKQLLPVYLLQGDTATLRSLFKNNLSAVQISWLRDAFDKLDSYSAKEANKLRDIKKFSVPAFSGMQERKEVFGLIFYMNDSLLAPAKDKVIYSRDLGCVKYEVHPLRVIERTGSGIKRLYTGYYKFHCDYTDRNPDFYHDIVAEYNEQGWISRAMIVNRKALSERQELCYFEFNYSGNGKLDGVKVWEASHDKHEPSENVLYKVEEITF